MGRGLRQNLGGSTTELRSRAAALQPIQDPLAPTPSPRKAGQGGEYSDKLLGCSLFAAETESFNKLLTSTSSLDDDQASQGDSLDGHWQTEFGDVESECGAIVGL
jgi:hypothetical protein